MSVSWYMFCLMVKCKVCNYLIMIMELKITIIIVYLYCCLVAAAVVVDYDDVLFFSFCFCVCYLHMQMQTQCRAVAISITTSYSISVKIFYSGLTNVFIASPFCDELHEWQIKRNHLSWICREPWWMSSLNHELS